MWKTMGDSHPGTGGWRTAPELYTHTHTHAYTRTHQPRSRAQEPGFACGSVSAAPLLPHGSRRPARPTTRTQPPPAPQQRRHREPPALRAQPRPLCAYPGNAAPAGANLRGRGAGLPRGSLKPPARARPGAWAAVKRPGSRSPPWCCSQSAHWGAAPQLAWGLWGAVLTTAPGTLPTLSRSPANGWDR